MTELLDLALELVSETEEPSFTIVEPLTRIMIDQLPQSPRKTALLAQRKGWDVSVWLTIIAFEATLYASDSAEHDKNAYSVGDVKWEAYTGLLYVVEARGGERLGFRAHYLGKRFYTERKAVGGSFEYARAADPLGFPIVLDGSYRFMQKLTRGKFETEKSWALRQREREEHLEQMREQYNDGETVMMPTHIFDTATDFTTWLKAK